MNSPDNFALLRLQLSQNLYYKLLSAVGNDEDRKMSFSNVPTRSASLQVRAGVHVHVHMLAMVPYSLMLNSPLS